MLTTVEVKHAMCTLLNAMLREDRVCCTSGDNFVSKNLKEDDVKRLLRDELEMYSYQFKQVKTLLRAVHSCAWLRVD